MTRRSVWRTLGIAWTDDARAIRRAYAERLKALDLDADAAGFQTLREARDEALRLSQLAVAEDTDDPSVEDEGEQGDDARWMLSDEWVAADASELAADIETVAPTPAAKAPSSDPSWSTIAETDERNGNQLVALLLDDESADALHPDDIAAAREFCEALLHSPTMDSIEGRERIEGWLARLLAETIPRSDPLLREAAEVFAWRDQAGSLSESWWVRQINERIAALVLKGALDSGQHSLSGAWRELTRPLAYHANARRGWFVRRKSIQALLTKVETEAPSLQRELVPERVGVWEHAPALGCTPWVLGVVLLQMVASLARCDSAPPPITPLSVVLPPAPGSPPVVGNRLTDEELDVLSVARATFGEDLTADALAKHQPGIDKLMRENWRLFQHEGRGYEQFFNTMTAEIAVRVKGMRPVPGSALEQRAVAQRLKILRLLRSKPAVCIAYPKTGNTGSITLPDELDRQMTAIDRLTLLEGQPGRSGKFQFTVPGPVIERIIQRTKLSSDQVGRALQGEGTARNVCAVEIALREASLDMPGAAVRAMRQYL